MLNCAGWVEGLVTKIHIYVTWKITKMHELYNYIKVKYTTELQVRLNEIF